MSQIITTTEIAMAVGALESRVNFVIGYPRIPGSKAIEYIMTQPPESDFEIQWATNGIWAMEEAIGSSLVGARTLVGIEQYSLATALNSLQLLPFTSVRASLVLLVGDKQESTILSKSPFSIFINRMPIFEPTDPNEAREMTIEAFQLSENYEIPVIIRVPASICHQKEIISFQTLTSSPYHSAGTEKQWHPPLPGVANGNGQLKRRLSEIGQLFELSSFNRVEGIGPVGIIAVGETYHKIVEVLERNQDDQFRILKLGTLNPIPQATIGFFLENVEKAIVFEDNAPFIERQILELAKYQGINIEIMGRKSQHISTEKVIHHWQIEEVLADIEPSFHANRRLYSYQKIWNGTHREDNCSTCLLKQTTELFYRNGQTREQPPIIIQDNLCANLKINTFEKDYYTGYPSESVIGIATGIAKAKPERNVIAITDAPAFIQTGINSLIQSAHIHVDLLVIIIDNNAAGATPNENEYEIADEMVPVNLPLQNLVEVCDVSFLRVLDDKTAKKLKDYLTDALKKSGIRVLVLKTACTLLR